MACPSRTLIIFGFVWRRSTVTAMPIYRPRSLRLVPYSYSFGTLSFFFCGFLFWQFAKSGSDHTHTRVTSVSPFMCYSTDVLTFVRHQCCVPNTCLEFQCLECLFSNHPKVGCTDFGRELLDNLKTLRGLSLEGPPSLNQWLL